MRILEDPARVLVGIFPPGPHVHDRQDGSEWTRSTMKRIEESE